MTEIKLRNISKSYENPQTEVLSNIDLNIKQGEFLVLFGPNGCGKTSLLNIISGLDNDFSGNIDIGNKDPSNARISMVFQNVHDSTFPWQTVLESVAFGLHMEGKSKEDRNHEALKYLELANLTSHKDKYIYQLSGGLKQLSSICRALAYNPEVMLFDEPFSSLDYKTSKRMALQLLDIWQKTRKTTVFISHDIDEAILLADKIAVLSDKPAKIKSIIDVKLTRPRKISQMKTSEFFDIRNQVLSSFLNNNKTNGGNENEI
ncbi:MAG: ABC transporter ATP-binding protein [Nanoarchaeota archaeon]|nr:ABC transporter ATP-binding protein [Nanoarchaeota archaeon]